MNCTLAHPKSPPKSAPAISRYLFPFVVKSSMVNLSSSNTNKVLVPSSVTIAAGQTTIVFNVTIVDNLLHDGIQSATVTASAWVGQVPQIFPVITQEPRSQTVSNWATATFSVTADGGALGYQWYFNSLPLAGANASTLALTNVCLASAAKKTCDC